MPSYPRDVEETLVIGPGFCAGCPLSVEMSPSFIAFKFPGDDGYISSTEMHAPGSQRLPCPFPLRQHIDSFIHKYKGGLQSCTLCRLAHQILLWAQGKLLSVRAVYIPGHLTQGADILSSQGLWSTEVFTLEEMTHCPLWFSHMNPGPLGPDAMVRPWPRLHLYSFPLITLPLGVLERCWPLWGSTHELWSLNWVCWGHL